MHWLLWAGIGIGAYLLLTGGTADGDEYALLDFVTVKLKGKTSGGVVLDTFWKEQVGAEPFTIKGGNKEGTQSVVLLAAADLSTAWTKARAL